MAAERIKFRTNYCSSWCRLSRWLNGRASAAFAGVPGSIPGWGVCDFFRFCQSFSSNVPFPLSLPLSFHSSFIPFLFLSLRPFVCALKYTIFPARLLGGSDIKELVFFQISLIWILWSHFNPVPPGGGGGGHFGLRCTKPFVELNSVGQWALSS